jgi:site-specific recombinase XerD
MTLNASTVEIDNGDLLACFTEEHLVRNSISEHRRGVTLKTLERLAEPLDHSLADLTPQDLMRWQAAELTRGICPNTLRNRCTMVSGFLSWAATVGAISFERATQLKSVSNARGGSARKEPRPYSKRELERWRELLDARYPLVPAKGKGARALDRYFRGGKPLHTHARRHAQRLQLEAQVSLALEEGLRRIEIFRLTIPELHYDNETIVVQTAKQEPGQRKEREIPFTEHSRQCVQEWLEFRKKLAPGHKRPWLRLTVDSVNHLDPLNPQSFQQFAHATDKIDPAYTWHRFRHSYATNRLRAGLPLEQLQILLGHARLEQTLAYSKIANPDIQKETTRTEAEFERLIGVAA